VLSTSPTITSATLVTPALGTPASGTLTNCTFPTLNQNTTGTAAGLSTTLAIASGGTGQTTAADAGSALGAIGVSQTWQNVGGSRSNGVTYTNSTGRPIMVSVTANPTSNNQSISVTVGGVSLGSVTLTAGYTAGGFQFIVPASTTYVVSTTGSLGTWAELR
jgi:hypothetical protein